MKPHQRRPSAADISLDQRQVLAAVNRAAKNHRSEFARVGRKINIRHALYEQLVGEPMRHEVLHEDNRRIVRLRKLAQLGKLRRFTVVTQHHAHRGAGTHPGCSHQVDRTFGTTHAHHDSAAERHQREDMPGHHDVLRTALV